MSATKRRSDEPERIGEPIPKDSLESFDEIVARSELGDVLCFVRDFASKYYGGEMPIAKSRIISLI
jgi:hypothetical protein